MIRRASSLFAVVLLATLLGCRAEDPEGTAETPAPAAATPTPPPPAAPPALTPAPAPTPTDGAATVPEQTGSAAGQTLRAAFLIVNGVYNTELAAPFDVFHHTRFHTQPGLETFTVSPDGKPVTTFEGLKIAADRSFANAGQIDILVIPSARGSMDADLQNPALIDWIRTTAGQARHVLSLCDGAFLLAKAGLLQGIPATTFPDDYGRFSQMFPGVDLRINVSFVDAGKIVTSQGGARSYEAAMHLVDRLYGRQVAEGIGKGLLVPWPPDPDTMTARVVEPTQPPPAATPGPG